MLLLDCLVDMNRCIGLTGNKLLYPLRHEATSTASPRKEKKQHMQCVFCFYPDSCSVLSAGLFQSERAEADQNSENRVTSWPQAQTAETAAVIKIEVVGHTIETPYELVMTQIILFVPDTHNPFWGTQKPPCWTQQTSAYFPGETGTVMRQDHSCHFHATKTLTKRRCEWVLKIVPSKTIETAAVKIC